MDTIITKQDSIKAEMKAAMIAKDTVKLSVMRGVSAAFTTEMVSEARIASGKTSTDALSDDECMKVIKKLVKQRKDSIEQFSAGGREDLAADEKAELAILMTLLPAQMSREDLTKAIESEIEKIKSTNGGEIDLTKKGQIVGSIIKALSENADGKDIKEVADALLK